MYYITHFIVSVLLPDEIKKVRFFTQQKDSRRFFLGRDAELVSKKQMGKFGKAVLCLSKKIPLPDEHALWMNDRGLLWLAHKDDHAQDKKELGQYAILVK